MRIVYSTGARFAGGGIGTTAYHAVRGLYRYGVLHYLLCGSFYPTEIPDNKIRALGFPSRVLRKLAVIDRSNRLWHLESLLFDAWASRQLEQADIFHVWGNYGLHSLQLAKSVGMVTLVERASSHPLCQIELVQEECARWGITFQVFHPSLHRALYEIEIADYVLVPSEFVRASFLERGLPKDRLLCVPFGVDTDRFYPRTSKTSDLFRVLFVGQVGVRKGVPYLLEAWRQLDWKDAELWLVGRIDPGFRSLLNKWKTLRGVKIIGHVSDPVSLYQEVSVFAFPTIEEGSALVTYEAQACGLPVITTPNAGSVVRDGIEGFLTPIRDVEALVAALHRLRDDVQLRQRMGNAARERASEYTWTRYTDRLLAAYSAAKGGS